MGRSGHITSFAIDVTTLEPYKSCGQLANKAQGSALGSLVPNHKMWFSSYYYKIKRIVTNVTILFIWKQIDKIRTFLLQLKSKMSNWRDLNPNKKFTMEIFKLIVNSIQ